MIPAVNAMGDVAFTVAAGVWVIIMIYRMVRRYDSDAIERALIVALLCTLLAYVVG